MPGLVILGTLGRPLLVPDCPHLPAGSMSAWGCCRTFQTLRCVWYLVEQDTLNFLASLPVLMIQVLAFCLHALILPDRASQGVGKQSWNRSRKNLPDTPFSSHRECPCHWSRGLEGWFCFCNIQGLQRTSNGESPEKGSQETESQRRHEPSPRWTIGRKCKRDRP